MFEERFNEVVQYLSNHFELFSSVAGAASVLFLLVIISLKFREVSLKELFSLAFHNIMFYSVAVGLASMLSMAGYLFWVNYRHPAPVVQFPGDILPHTHWVRDSLKVYFIDGNTLGSVRINGQDKKDIFQAEDPIKEYHFSPDGKFILVSTSRKLHSVERGSGRITLIDSLGEMESSQELKGAISGIHWAPDSRKFCYEMARWSRYASQDKLYVYDLVEGKKMAIQSPTRRISSLYWDKDSQNLYYLRHEAKDTSVHAYPFDVRVFRISLAALQPEFVTEIPYEQSTIPIENLDIRGIDLFLGGDRLSFNPSIPRESLVSQKGQSLGIDEEGHLYFVPNRWFRKRLFKIVREPVISQMPRHQYKGGDLVIEQIRWIPGGRYAIMQHRYLGVLILEPATCKVGLLVEVKGHTLGWYEDVRKK